MNRERMKYWRAVYLAQGATEEHRENEGQLKSLSPE